MYEAQIGEVVAVNNWAARARAVVDEEVFHGQNRPQRKAATPE